jgi:hypothetical protein
VFQTVIAHLHTLSIQIHSYLDDSLIKDFDQQTLVSQTELVIQLFLNLFFFFILQKVGVDSFTEFYCLAVTN